MKLEPAAGLFLLLPFSPILPFPLVFPLLSAFPANLTFALNEEPLQNHPFLTQLLDSSVEGILAFDRDFRYIEWNKAMERISGLKRADVLGKCAFDVFPFIEETGEDKYLRAASPENRTTSDNRPYVVPETGRQGFFKAYYSPLLDAGEQYRWRHRRSRRHHRTQTRGGVSTGSSQAFDLPR